jgi:glucuronoarabinoxylan endo-1,4-beta-xylanase
MSISRVKAMALASIHLVIATLFVMGAGLLHAQNLLTNGGFEGGLTGWTNATSGSVASASFSLETANPYAGTRALKTVINNTGPDNWNVESRAPIFTGLGTGKSLTVTFRARASTADATINAAFQNGTGTYRAQAFTLSTSWAFYTWNHTTIQDSPGFKFQYRSVGTVWLDQVSVVVNPTPPAGIAVTPTLSSRRQIMDGIGGSIAFNLPHYERLSATQKDQIENLLYVDCGVDIVRLRTGNTDALNNELAMRAQRNGAKSLLTCWSPPASLKSNNSIVSGTLRIVSGNYDYAGFADWWYDRLVASSWGHDFISIQNEPSYDPGDKETCRLFANETVPATTSGSASYKKALEAVYNRIKNEPKIPQFIAVDAETHSAFSTIAPTVSGLSFVNHMGFHNYGTNNFGSVKSRYNGNRGWMTEWGKDASPTDPIGIKEDWMLLAANIHDSLVEADASAYLAWRMVHGANTGQVWAMIGVNAPNTTGGVYTVQNAFHVVKHYAKEISPGDQRFDVTMTGTTTNISISGFIDSAGKKLTLIALNEGSAATNLSLRLSGLPVASIAAFQTKEADTNAAGTFTNPYQALGSINPNQSQSLPAESITSYVISLSETLNPYDPELLVVDWIQHYGDRVSLGMPAQPGQNFILWKSTNLAAGSWQKVTNAVFLESGDQLILTDPTPGAASAFYRVQRDTGL